MINPEDLNLVQVIDEPEQVVDAIFNHYQSRGFLPAARRARADAQPVSPSPAGCTGWRVTIAA